MPVGVQCPISSSLGKFPSYWDWLWCPGLLPVLVSIALPLAFHTQRFPFALICHWISNTLLLILYSNKKRLLTPVWVPTHRGNMIFRFPLQGFIPPGRAVCHISGKPLDLYCPSLGTLLSFSEHPSWIFCSHHKMVLFSHGKVWSASE